MRRLPLRHDSSPAGDSRAAMLAVVALMLLLMPFLLLTTSPQKLTSLSLHLAGDGGDVMPLRTGAVEKIEVELAGDRSAEVRARVRRTDLGAAEGEVHERVVSLVPDQGRFDLPGIQQALLALQRLDPAHERAHVLPADSLPTQEVVEVVDVVRIQDGMALFPDIVLEAQP